MAEVTITVQPPGAAAALALFGAVVAIDVAAIRFGQATVSRWIRHQARHRPAATLTAAIALGLHLYFDIKGDPAGWAAHQIGQGDA